MPLDQKSFWHLPLGKFAIKPSLASASIAAAVAIIIKQKQSWVDFRLTLLLWLSIALECSIKRAILYQFAAKFTLIIFNFHQSF